MKTFVTNGKIKMEQICPEKDCTSCMACYSICPVNAIHIVVDSDGFYRPRIDSSRCIGCKRCVHVCPAHGHVKKFQPHTAIAAYARDKLLRKQSTSGGAFTVIATHVIQSGGVVFGAAYDKEFTVRHMWADTVEALAKFRTSKYVQSCIGKCFQQAKEFLDNGRLVFFTGTPCQVNGLRQYLGKPYDNLLTADIVCHGTPTPKIFHEYLENIKAKIGGEIQSVRFRYKTNNYKKIGEDCLHNMKIVLNNGSVYIKDKQSDPYILGFFSNLFLNPACYHCLFATEQRTGDITLADFWGFKAPSLRWVNTGKGISLILLNTNKGEKIFDIVKSQLVWCERPIKEAISGNPHLSYPISKGEQYDNFWKDYRTYGYKYVEKKYFFPISRTENTLWKMIKIGIPIHLRWILKKLLGKE